VPERLVDIYYISVVIKVVIELTLTIFSVT
jgi:hypothetical protein